MAIPKDLTIADLQKMASAIREASDMQTGSLFVNRSARDQILTLDRSFPVGGERSPIHDGGQVGYWQGHKVIVNEAIPKKKEFDWSGCRSPSRAKRRYAQGHPQRVKITETDVAYLISDKFLKSFQMRFEQQAIGAIMGSRDVF